MKKATTEARNGLKLKSPNHQIVKVVVAFGGCVSLIRPTICSSQGDSNRSSSRVDKRQRIRQLPTRLVRHSFSGGGSVSPLLTYEIKTYVVKQKNGKQIAAITNILRLQRKCLQPIHQLRKMVFQGIPDNSIIN